MPKCKYDWPVAGERKLIGQRISRVDGPAKTSGKAKYTYDVNLTGMLYGKILRSPYAHCKITALDTSAAESMPGVKAVRKIQDVGKEIQWAGDEIVAVAAESEDIARDALDKIKIEFEQLPHLVNEEDLSKAGDHGKAAGSEKSGDPDKAFSDPEVVISEGYYGIATITHCCLETHGSVAAWTDPATLKTYFSTQNVSGIPGEVGEALRQAGIDIKNNDIETICQYIGGGFGSKFGADRWGIENARLAKLAGKPVKLLLERDMDLEVAGARPSSFAKIKVAAKKDWTIVAWQSDSWGTGGPAGTTMPPLPYVFTGIPNKVTRHTSVGTNTGPARAWRAPNHPQAAVLTMGALDDLAAKLNMDPLEFFSKNADLAGERGEVYRQELRKAAELIEWQKNWHPRGHTTPSSIKRGLGISLHTWGGRGHNSNCNVAIHPDGSVEISLGSQDLGTGTRTVITIVAAETLGLPLEAITLNIGDTKYPASGASGGSTTVGGVSASTRRGCIDALDQLFAAVAPSLGVPADQLIAAGERSRRRTTLPRALPGNKPAPNWA